MERNNEGEMSANEAAGRPELKRKDCILHMKPESCNVLESPTVSECPESSTLGYTDILDDDSLNRCKLSLGGAEIPYTRPCSTTNAGLMVEELTVRNYKIPNSALVSGSNTREGIHCRSRNPYEDFTFGDKDPRLLSYREDLLRIPFGLKDSQPLSSKQNNRDLDEIPAHLIDSCNKNDPNKTLPHLENRSKILSSSSFSQFFGKQSLKGNLVLSKSHEAYTEYSVTAVDQNTDKQAIRSRTASDALLNSSSKIEQPCQHSIDRGGFESFVEGISLRELLKPGCCEMNKAERLHLFRQIVQLVDFAHSKGVVLQDLRLSCFTLLPSNRVIYSGSSTTKELPCGSNQDLIGKRALEQGMHVHSKWGVKQQKIGEGMKLIKQQPQFTSRCGVTTEAVNEIDTNVSGLQDFDYTVSGARKNCNSPSIQTLHQSSSAIVQLEKKWYACSEEFNGSSLLPSNIYSLGVLLFELLCCFESLEMHSAAMLDLRHQILPSNFLSENPKEAGFCLWLLHPEPSSRPTIREILQSELLCGSEELSSVGDLSLCSYKDDDDESELLLHFLVSLKEQKQKHASELLEKIAWLEADTRELERRQQGNHPRGHTNTGILSRSFSGSNMLEARLMGNISQLENAYFRKRSQVQPTETTAMERPDKDLLRNHDGWSRVHIENKEPFMEEKAVDFLRDFYEGICKFTRYSKFEVCGTLRNGDLLNSANVVCSLSCDREEDYIAAAGVSKKIKIFEFASLLNGSVDIHYPVVEMSSTSKLSCVCWNKYIRNYLASTDYDGVVQMWDASTGQGFSQYIEHQKRTWSVDFSQVNPMKFASGSDDCSVKLWSINEKSSTDTIRNPVNVCCVQFSPYSTHLLAFGSADYKIYCYDLRHTRIPWCTLAGHGKAVSFVRFLDSETLVSASTDNTLKLWDLNKTSLEGLSSNACSSTFSGHTNEKNFVGLSVLDGYIACGSETNEVFAYYRSLPMPITSHNFGFVDPVSGHEINDTNGQFVSSVCWRGKSNMVVAANSSGSIKLLQML